MNLKIRTKILGGFLVLILLMAGVATLGVMGLSALATTYAEITDRTDVMMVEAERLDGADVGLTRSVLGHLLTRDPRYKQELEQSLEAANASLANLRKLARTPEESAAINEAEHANSVFVAIVLQAFSRSTMAQEEIQELVVQKLPPARAKVDAATDKLTELIQKLNDDQKAGAEARTALTRNFSIIVALVAAGGGILFALFLSGAIARPVVAVAGVARRMADGDLTVEEIRVASKDEVAEMARSINQMAAALRQTLRQVSSSTQAVMAASEELSATSEGTAQAAQGAAQAIGQVAAGAGDQSKATVEVTGTMEELRAVIDQIAAGAGQAAGEVQQVGRLLSEMAERLELMAAESEVTAEGAHQTAAAAEAGAEVVGRTLREMEQIKSVVIQSAERIRALDSLSERISAITGAISGIAEQTNLLALNAAIEAARAGEHGRGFAVVAEEVRKLAERAAASTREITDLTAAIQSGTAEAVLAMEAGTRQVAEGARLAAEAGDALRMIRGSAGAATVAMEQIVLSANEVKANTTKVVGAFDALAALTEENTASTEEMAAGATEVMRAIDRIARVSQENAASSQEVSAAVEELTASSEEVSSSAQSLARTAQELQEQVERFRI